MQGYMRLSYCLCITLIPPRQPHPLDSKAMWNIFFYLIDIVLKMTHPRWWHYLFTESAHWADSVIESHCLSVSMCVCVSPPCEIYFQASHWPTGHMTTSQASHWSPSPHPERAHVGPRGSHVMCRMLHVTCHVSHVTCHVSRVTCLI